MSLIWCASQLHVVMPSVAVCTSSEHAMGLEDMKHVVHLLHTALHLPEHHLLQERQLLEKMDNLKQELSPLEKVCVSIRTISDTASQLCLFYWTGFYELGGNPTPYVITVQMKAQLSNTAQFQTSRAVWTGMALLSVQGGALAWLTWWVYSWDVMEPVTYFITYATSIGAFGYYVLTKQASFRDMRLPSALFYSGKQFGLNKLYS